MNHVDLARLVQYRALVATLMEGGNLSLCGKAKGVIYSPEEISGKKPNDFQVYTGQLWEMWQVTVPFPQKMGLADGQVRIY